MAKSLQSLQITFVLLFIIAGFFLGGMVGKLKIPAGSGLAGPAILLVYMLSGAAIALIAGIILARILNEAQLKKGRLVVFLLAVAALVAIVSIPKKKIATAAGDAPQPFSPAYVFDFSPALLPPEGNPANLPQLPFSRIRLRADDRFFMFDFYEPQSQVCSGRIQSDENLRALLSAIRAVLAECEANPQLSAPESCPECRAYYLLLIPEKNAPQTRLELTDRYLQTQPAGKELLRVINLLYEEIKPGMWCD